MNIKNKKIKNGFSWFFKIFLSTVLIAFVCMAPFTLLPNLLKEQAEVNRGEDYEYQGILELWHIETFEGGSASRSGFLEREAINFENQHKGTYIVIQTMSLEQFKLNINAQKFPNIISFGIGVGDEFIDKLVELDSPNVRSDLSSAGKFSSKQLGVPYILGGYALISKSSGKIGVGLKGATNPLKSMAQNNMQIANIYDDLNLDSYDIYDKFLKGNFDTLLGTQRDVYRCYNRQQRGLLSDASFTFLGGYTDLVQYLSIFKGSLIEEKLCKQFVLQMISVDVQSKLKNYNLFSTLNNLSLYNEGLYKDFEEVLQKKLTVENAFLGNEQIKSQKAEALKTVVKN